MSEHSTTASSGAVSPATSQASAFGQRVWDRLGVVLSGLCLVHCLLLPVALLVLPGFTLLGAVHETAHLALALLLLPVTYAALRHPSHGGSRNRRAAGKWLLLSGIALVWLALPVHKLAGEGAETVATIVGSIALVGGHVSHLLQRTARPIRHTH